MSKSNGLRRMYDHLSVEERWRLDVLATARGDQEESEYLTNSCPKRDYIMNDWGFSGRWHAARELAMLTYMDAVKCLDKIQMIKAFRAALPYFRQAWQSDTHGAYFKGHASGMLYAWAKAGMKGKPPAWEEDEAADEAMGAELETLAEFVEQVDGRITDALDNLEHELATEGFTVWAAFSGFCSEEMGVEALNLLAAAFGPFAEKAKGLIALGERLEIEPDAEAVAEYRSILERAWRNEVDKGKV